MSTNQDQTKRPNILWICTDQQRFDTLGCYNNPFVRTPNLDKLAQKGVLFQHCYAQSPVCTPSRASFLTGRYPRTTRCRQNGQSIPEDEVLVTRLLAEDGYVCGLSGKLHLSACHPSVCSGMERRIDDGYATFHWSHHPSPNWPTNEYNLWLKEKGVTYSHSAYRDSNYVRVSMPAEHHQTTWCAEKAINFIEASQSFDTPWLFSVNIYDPHPGFNPPEEYLNYYLERLDEIPLPNYVPGELDDKPHFQQLDHHALYTKPQSYPAANLSPEEHRLLRAAYWAMINLIDEQVGRMIAALERTDQLDNTIVIFMSDHGEMLGDHGIYLKGPYFYEPAVRVPLIVSWPKKFSTGVQASALVELTDIAPTLLEAAGLEPYPGMQGKSLLPLLTAQQELDLHREDVYCEYYNAKPPLQEPKTFSTMVRTKRHKLVVVHERGEGELYDLEQDPTETHNCWDDLQYQAVKSAMLIRLCDRMARTIDPLPERRAPW